MFVGTLLMMHFRLETWMDPYTDKWFLFLSEVQAVYNCHIGIDTGQCIQGFYCECNECCLQKTECIACYPMHDCTKNIVVWFDVHRLDGHLG
jgi:hypothetical protein